MSVVLQRLRAAAKARWTELIREETESSLAAAESVRFVPIASGKGGVGKTNVAVGISVSAGLSFQGTDKRVLLIDGDLGLPNTDLVLGVRPVRSLDQFVDRSIEDISLLVSPTRYPSLDFIAGAEEATLVLGNLYYQQRQRLMGKIAGLKASLVIFDLGASASKEILDFFAMSPSGIVVLNPEPTSIRDGYVFIKNALIRRFRQAIEEETAIRQELDKLVEETGGHWMKLKEVLPTRASKELKAAWEKLLAEYRPMIIVNRAESFAEGLETARKFTADVEKLLGIKIMYLGSVLRDEAVPRAVKAQRPFRIAEPAAAASKCIDAITKNLLEQNALDLSKNFSSLGRILTSRLVGRPV
jgi:flagellar biosynthesis protein FlhG